MTADLERIPTYVRNVIDRLEKNGHEAYIVGGCVRDILSGRVPHDFDVATSAVPDETERIFADFGTHGYGRAHGTVCVISDSHPVEVTTFRKDGEYGDFRHPDGVTFTENLADDLARRDFTMNAMAYSSRRGLTDIFGGREDIDARRIRCVGDPDTRFREDALRIMRALRFASVLGFEIDTQTAEAATRNRGLLAHVSRERIYAELSALLEGEYAARVICDFADVVAVILPRSFEKMNLAKSFPLCYNDSVLRLALLLFPSGEDGAEKIARSLCADRECVRRVARLVRFASGRIPKSAREIALCAAETGVSELRECLVFSYAVSFDDGTLESIRTLDRMIADGTCLSFRDLEVTGDDLLRIGIPSGKQLGLVLRALLSDTACGICENDKSRLLEAAKNIYSRKEYFRK